MSEVNSPLIDRPEGEETGEEQKDENEQLQIIYNHSKKLLISDSGKHETYTSYFSLKNISSQKITVDSVQITTGEGPSEPIVDTQLQVPGTAQWADFIEFRDLGTLAPGEETKPYEFTYSIIRAIAGPSLPDCYINKVYFYPCYTVNSKYQPKFVYDVEVVKVSDSTT